MKKNIFKIATLCLIGSASLMAETPSEILHKSLTYIAGLDKFKVTAVSQNLLMDSRNTVRAHYTNKYEALVDRPYKLKITVDGETKHREYFFNNGLFTLYNKEQVRYWGDARVPADTDKALEHIMKVYNERPTLSILVDSTLDRKVNPKSITYFGVEKKNGVMTYHLAFKTKDGKRDIHVWIKANGEPLIVAYSIIRKNSVNEYRQNINVKWTIDPFFMSDKDFVFTKRSGSQKIPIQIKKKRKF